ncbi:hypothetical protein QAD02_016962 [Eretmocerus hayati]|uniref:Uncharacterized protein n=1 Tax=Eretmocerus hayati TaxID=131215 RepID=A0ACC2PC20_9HYME|nr:hypothetical protein QAD02_016962 [Eretmocerus hayati]
MGNDLLILLVLLFGGCIIHASLVKEELIPTLNDVLNDLRDLVRIASESYNWGSNSKSTQSNKMPDLTKLRGQIFDNLARISIKIPNDHLATLADKFVEKQIFVKNQYEQNDVLLQKGLFNLTECLIRGDGNMLSEALKEAKSAWISGGLTLHMNKRRKEFLQFIEDHNVGAPNNSLSTSEVRMIPVFKLPARMDAIPMEDINQNSIMIIASLMREIKFMRD